jgi:predicted ATP-dependent endonuclease of OLD family
VEIQNFRGIANLTWAPSAGINCLIGPGDSAKTTVLDAIEIALTPRYAFVGDDADFFDMDVRQQMAITITLVDLPAEFHAEKLYGLHLRGWDAKTSKVVDEPAEGLQEALSIRFTIDQSSLEGRWNIYNDRLDNDGADPPAVRLRDSPQISPTRLGPYADRHLGWGRNSVLNRIADRDGGLNQHLARASRAAREAFRKQSSELFDAATSRAEQLSKVFGVPVREKYTAEIDVQASSLSSGGVTLHDARLPLRTLGTGSARLVVAGLQHGAGGSRIALVDEVEHGLEPHRIALMVKHLRSAVQPAEGNVVVSTVETAPLQIFMTTHSPVVVRELQATEISAVRRASSGATFVHALSNSKDAQRPLRGSPDAFMARRILVGEGRTECGILRGLDHCWSQTGKESFSLRGVIPISGNGSEALAIAEYLLDLGYDVFVLLDSDELPDAAKVESIKGKHGKVEIWPDECAIEHRLFLDLPWATVQALVNYAAEPTCVGTPSVLQTINTHLSGKQLERLVDLSLPSVLDSTQFRRILGQAAHKSSWFKMIEHGERVAELIFADLVKLQSKPFGAGLTRIRDWIDA